MSFDFTTTEDSKDKIWVDVFNTFINLSSSNKKNLEKTLKELAKHANVKIKPGTEKNQLSDALNVILLAYTAKLKSELSKKKTGRNGQELASNFFTVEDLTYIAKCIKRLYQNVDLSDGVFNKVKGDIEGFNHARVSGLSHSELIAYITQGFQYTIAYVWQHELFGDGKKSGVRANMMKNFLDAQAEKREAVENKKIKNEIIKEMKGDEDEVKRLEEEMKTLKAAKDAKTKELAMKKDAIKTITGKKTKEPKAKKEPKETKAKKEPKAEKEPKEAKPKKEPKAKKEPKEDKPKKITKQTKTTIHF